MPARSRSLAFVCGVTELAADPVRYQRPVLERDVVAHVGAVFVEHPLGVGHIVGDPLGLLPGDDAVSLAGDDEARLLDPLGDAGQIQLVGSEMCIRDRS